MSVGAGGARLTTGPRGTRVSYSKDGFYYRTRLDTKPARQAMPQPAASGAYETTADETVPISPEPAVLPTAAAPTPTSPEVFGDTTADALVEMMNKRIRRTNLAIPTGLLAGAAAYAAATGWASAAVSTSSFAAVAVGIATAALTAWFHHRFRQTILVYEDDAETAGRLEVLHRSAAALRSAHSLWSVREMTSENGLTPQPAALSRVRISEEPPRLPQYLRTNVTPASLQLAEAVLYFFPDRLFSWHEGRFASMDYSQIKVRFTRITFLERQGKPPDAVVESLLPRSLSGDSTIPVLYYGMVHIDGGTAFRAQVMSSRAESGQEFVHQLQTMTASDGASEKTVTEHSLYTHFDNRVPLFYDLSAEGWQQLRALKDALSVLKQSEYVWRYAGEERTDDWKRNAGAGTLVTRSRIAPTVVESDARFESNVAFGLAIGDATLFVLPDRLVLGTGRGLKDLGQSLSVNAHVVSFREEEAAPRDAELIGETWRYVNKSGGPDRRFKDNPRIPMYRYGQLDFTCGAWHVRLCVSRAATALDCAIALNAALNKNAARPEPPAPPASRVEGTLAAAFALLDVPAGASPEEVASAYRTLAVQNHPDKVAHMAPEFRDLAESKMRKLNAAYELIRSSREAAGPLPS